MYVENNMNVFIALNSYFKIKTSWKTAANTENASELIITTTYYQVLCEFSYEYVYLDFSRHSSKIIF